MVVVNFKVATSKHLSFVSFVVITSSAKLTVLVIGIIISNYLRMGKQCQALEKNLEFPQIMDLLKQHLHVIGSFTELKNLYLNYEAWYF